MVKNDFKIVTIGGGSGSSVLLHGLKNFTKNITAIVTAADDGGGSGILREDLGMLPPGDIRSCLVALSNSEKEMADLMKFRFSESSGRLSGQSFGNIFLAAMSEIYKDFETGLKEASKVLAITGKVLPMTLEDVTLYAKLENGMVIEGESNITFLARKEETKIDHVFLKPEIIRPPFESLDDINGADMIVLGPGSLYTSIMPNLLVKDLLKAIIDSKAIKVYILNIMTQAGETIGYRAIDHIDAIYKHAGENFLDYVIVNNKEIDERIKLKYKYKDKTEQILLNDLEKKTIEARELKW